MRIARIETTRHRLPLEPAFPPTWDPRPRPCFDVTLVRVESEDGHFGVGSGDDMPGFAGHEDLFVGRDPLDLERHARVIDNLSLLYGRCWPLDIALWDLAGKIRGEPCWRMLGGRSGRVPLYASAGVRREPEAAADLARRVLELGFAALKLRFWRDDWKLDLAAVEAARGAVGDRLALIVDCNQAWRMPWDTRDPWSFEQALAIVERLGALGVRWVEEPLHRGDYTGLARLRAQSGVAIAGGELTRELHDARELVVRGCVDVLQTDAVLIGGFSGLVPLARLARERGIDFTPHTWGNGVGLLANAHLYAGVGGAPWLEFPFDPPEWTPERRDYPLAQPLRAQRGWLELGEAPGLGLALDEARLAETRISSAI